jgi:hypothetical protein
VQTICDPDVDVQELNELSRVQDELTCTADNLILRNGRIVILHKMRDQAVSLAHEGHQGIARTKALIRL